MLLCKLSFTLQSAYNQGHHLESAEHIVPLIPLYVMAQSNTQAWPPGLTVEVALSSDKHTKFGQGVDCVYRSNAMLCRWVI